MGERVFADEWRACQDQHLLAVLAAGDARTEKTLVQVLQSIGFTEDRLVELGAALRPPRPVDEAPPETPPVTETTPAPEAPPPVAATEPTESREPTERTEPLEAPPPEVAEAVDEEVAADDDEAAAANETPGQLSLF